MSYFKFFKRTIATTLCVAVVSSNVASAASVGTITGDNVNIRSDKTTDSSVISKVTSGDAITIVGIEDGWFKVTSPVSDYAYITSDYVQVTKAEGTVIDNSVNIRQAASLQSEVIATANTGDTLTITGKVNEEWLSIDYYGTTAYIHSDYVNSSMLPYLKGTTAIATNAQPTDNVYATVTSSDLNLRAGASTEANVIKRLPNGYTLDVLGYDNGWIRVSDGSSTGFVKSDYIDLKNGKRPVSSVASSTVSGNGNAVVEYAKQFIGTPYSYGGTDLNNGVDCSGFTYAVYKHFGINLNRVSRDQITDGISVNKENLQPGDLVFFNSGGNSSISHVGIYVGNGEYIHSTDAQNYIGVIVSSLGSDYSMRTYVGACRVMD